MFKLFKNLTKKEIILIIFSLLLILVQVKLDLTMPDYMSKITVLVQTEGSEMKEILKNGALMLGCAAGSLITTVIVSYMAANIASSFSTVMRSKIFEKIQKFSTEEMKKFSTSSLITRTTNDITQVDMVIGLGLQLLVKAVFTSSKRSP